MKVVTRDRVVIRYLDEGRQDRPAIVFSNSLGTDLQVWHAVAPAFAERFRIIRYDKRGHGLSDAPPAPYVLDDHVQDLAAVLDAAGVGAAIVVGLSVGGMIAQGLAGTRPDRVRALVLCDTGHRIGSAELWNGRIEAVRAGGIAALADPILERWFSAQFRKQRPAEVAIWRNMLVRTPVEGYVGTCAAIRDADLTEVTRGLRVPTLCLCGSEDGATTPDLVREMAALIPDARFQLVDGAGHLPCVESPAAVVAAIDAFLRRHGLDG